MKQLYICDIGGGRCVTHDGYIQIGIMSHSVERHLELNPTIDWQVTYWMPDVFINRYKRVSFQKTEKKNEGSPKTDNAGQGSVEFGSKPRGCNKLEDK
mgnify:CR=1 FL=1